MPPSNPRVFLSDMPAIIVVCFLLSHIHVCSPKCVLHIADFGLFVLMHLICSLYLTFIALPDCPTYAPLHVLHFSLYIPLGSLYVCFSLSRCCVVLVVLKAIFNLVFLNRLVTHLISGLKGVKVIHFLRATVFSCCCFWLCFQNINFVLRLCIMSVGYALVFAIARMIFHSYKDYILKFAVSSVHFA